MRRFLRTTLKICGVVLASFSIVAIVLALVVLFAPQLLVNTRTVTKVARYFYTAAELDWQTAQVELTSRSPLQKRLRVQAEALRVHTAQLQGTLPYVAAEIILNLDPRKNLLDTIGPITMEGLDAKLKPLPKPRRFSQDDEQESESKLEQLSSVLNTIGGYHVRDLRLSVANFVVEQAQSTISGQGELAYQDAKPQSLKKHFRLSLNQLRGLPLKELKGEGQLVFEPAPEQAAATNPMQKLTAGLEQKTVPTELSFEGQATLAAAGGRVLASLKATPVAGSPAWDVHLRSSLQQGSHRSQAELNGSLAPQSARFEISAQTRGALPYFRSLEAENCHLQASWSHPVSAHLKASLRCQGAADRLPVTDEAMVQRFLPRRFGLHLNADLSAQGAVGKETLQVTAKLLTDRVEGKTMALGGFASLEGSLPLARPAAARFRVSYDFDAHIKRFAALVADLRATHWAVPAPFNQLAGDASCRSSGDFNFASKHGNVPLHCKVQLEAKPQSIVVAVDGGMVLKNSGDGPQGGRIQPELALKVDVESLDLVLPRIELGKPFPRLFSDKRMRAPDAPSASRKANHTSTMPYHIEIASRGGSIRVHSNLLAKPLPLSVRATLRHDRPLQGSIAVDDYQVELLRRKVELKHFAMDLADDPSEQTINGLVRFKHNIYRIFLKVYGTVAQPAYSFTSEPTLPEQDILALILFGSKPDALDSDRLRSVDETRAALTDGAISLLSMYFLAATPVENIGYNPHSQMFTANIKLREGLSLSLGTDADARNQFGLTKRLGRNTTIETRMIHDQTTDENRGVAMLKWGLRY